jgi:hypothetical protein
MKQYKTKLLKLAIKKLEESEKPFYEAVKILKELGESENCNCLFDDYGVIADPKCTKHNKIKQ